MIGRAMLRWPVSARLLLAPHASTAPTSTLLLPLRAYATPGRPKTVVGEPSRAVKRAVKRDAAAPADGTSPAERKLAASKRNAAAKKSKLQLTEEEIAVQEERMEAAKAAAKARREKKKAATKARAEKDRLVELKKVALDAPSRPFASAYTSYTAEQFGITPLTDENGTKLALADRMRKIAATWNTLPPADIEHYNHIARVKVEKDQAEYKRWVESHTPDEIRKANAARTELNRKLPSKNGRKAKYPEIVDERVVSRPRNAFIHFFLNRTNSGDLKNLKAKDRMKLLAQEWQELSQGEKSKYEELSKQDRLRYVEEYQDTYGHAAASAAG